MQITPADAILGALVTDTDLSVPLEESTIGEIQAAIAEHKVLSFPDQPLTLEQLEAFTEQLGEFGPDPFIEPMAGHPN
jgi:taurine dioxygenase